MENIGQLVKQISNKLINDLNENLKNYEITFSQLQVLLIINENNESVYLKDIADFMHIKHSSVIDIIKVLERKKLVKRSTSEINAKFTEVSLTENGNNILINLDFGKDKTEEMMADILGFNDVNDMNNKFKLVLEKLENKDY